MRRMWTYTLYMQYAHVCVTHTCFIYATLLSWVRLLSWTCILHIRKKNQISMLTSFQEEKLFFSMIVVQNRRQCCVATQWHQDHKGELSALVQKMHIMDEEKHYLYFWMPATKSDVVARSIGECIQPQTPHRAQINVVERSAVTLHYLAPGCLHVSAHWGGVLFQR